MTSKKANDRTFQLLIHVVLLLLSLAALLPFILLFTSSLTEETSPVIVQRFLHHADENLLLHEHPSIAD
jgi:ABC-type glycerol-3-phosphate transport system permease component